MKISVISVAAAGNEELSVGLELSDGEHRERKKLLLSMEAYTALGIAKGECTRELYEQMEHEASVYGCFKRGMYILGYGSCSKRRLVAKLTAKGFGRQIAEEAAERIEQGGFLDCSAAARREAELCAAKLWGERRIRAQLFSKGYEKEDIEEAMLALEDLGVDYEANCAELVRRKYGIPPSDKDERQRAIGALTRYGYSLSQIQRAFRIALNDK